MSTERQCSYITWQGAAIHLQVTQDEQQILDAPPNLREPVRLVTWEKFWKGILTEGGFVYCRDTHDIVIALAKRGIVGSICSKTDRTRVSLETGT